MIEKTNKDAIVLWQDGEEGIPGEPALLITAYSDCIEVKQEASEIRINMESMPELIKVLNGLKNSKK